MIGVIAESSEHAVVSEFFELFKTPWELYRRSGDYEVVLCASDAEFECEHAKLVLFYSGNEISSDSKRGIENVSASCNAVLSYGGFRIPIYGNCLTFEGSVTEPLAEEKSHRAVMRQYHAKGKGVVRIGYDIFREVGALLTVGQPAIYANTPTVDLHIALLRNLIVASGVSLVEIPPVPDGYQFITCLTHDVDHPAIANHRWDHTVAGFLYRSTLGALWRCLQGRVSVPNLLANWLAAAKLPLVYLGLAKDFWSGFEDRYLKLEEGLRSTFFVIPFKGRPGKGVDAQAPRFRAAGYGARDIECSIRKILAAGCEVGLHGIDAWRDSESGREELAEIRSLTGKQEIGVRMHWLFFDQRSPATLEQAETAYDSSIGYRETVGYRAGTLQAYKPLQAHRLIELPMHVMDTALFYPAYLGLSQVEASSLLRQMMDTFSEFGGCMTINWHDRSLAPERIWDASYRELLQELKSRGAWFATVEEATSWFRMRRAVVFEEENGETVGTQVGASCKFGAGLPRMRARVHLEQCPREAEVHNSVRYIDRTLRESGQTSAPLLSASQSAESVA